MAEMQETRGATAAFAANAVLRDNLRVFLQLKSDRA
jgi:hypothetical protein